MKHHSLTLLTAALLLACTGPAAWAQNVDALPAIAGSAVDKAADKILIRDASVSAAAGALRTMTVADLAIVPGLFGTAAAAASTDFAAYKNQPQPISFTYGPHGEAATWTVSGITHGMAKCSFVSPAYAVRQISLVFPSFKPAVSGVMVETAKVIVRASIECPSGTLTPIFFAGKRDAIIESGTFATSDLVGMRIPASTQYWVRVYFGTVNADLRSLPANVRLRTGDGNGLNLGMPGSAATATLAQSGGGILSATLTAAGSGYPANTSIACVITGTGTGADITAFVNASGSIDKFLRINAAGTGYTGTPTIAIPGMATGSNSFGGLPIDKTLLGTMSGSAAYSTYGPSSIRAVAESDAKNKRSYVLLGDSITIGYYDTNSAWDGWPKRVHTTYGASFVNLAMGGATLSDTWGATSQNWQQVALAEGCTDAIVALGVNDFNAAKTLLQAQTAFEVLVTRLQKSGLRVSACTLTPVCSTSNVPSSWEATRVAYNEWLRTKPLGLDQVFDTADTLETARNSGIWKASHMNTGEATYLHPNATGYDAMAAAFAGIIN